MPRLPIVPTIVVALAVAAMIGLGVWQLQRRSWKEALLAQYTRNLTEPPTSFPKPPVGHEELLFRKSSAFCIEAHGWERQAGRNRDGATGWLLTTRCRTGAEGPGLRVALGVTDDPKFEPDWKGGEVRGVIAQAPDHRPLIATLFGKAPPRELMLIADTAPEGLEPSMPPDPSTVPNNHLAYAVQWFIFAALAVVIYLLALRRRGKKQA